MDGTEPYDASSDTFTPQNNGMHYPTENEQQTQLEASYGSNFSNETPFSAGIEGRNDSNMHSSVGSSVSHQNSGPMSFSKHEDEVFQVDRSSLENPTFKVHAKVIPNLTPRDSTNSNKNNDFQDTDAGDNEDCSIPKSDSINIFSIQSDPFDDVFFKF